MEKLTRIIAYIVGLYWLVSLITALIGCFAMNGAVTGQVVVGVIAVSSVIFILLALFEAVRARR